MNEKPTRTIEANLMTPIAIIGMSCIFPKANNLQAYWANIKNGVDAITEVPEHTHWKIADYYNSNPKSPDQTYSARGGFLSPVNFDPLEFGFSPKDIEATDTTQLLGLVAAKEALQDAGYGKDKSFNRERTSVILGLTGTLELAIPLGARLGHPIWRRALQEAGVESTVAEDVVQRIADSYVGWQENSFPGLLGNVTAGRIANRLNLGGTNCVVDAACASSLSALHLAGLELAAGRSDMVVAGGVDTFNDIFMYMCFSKTPALSPTGDAKPFAQGGDGTILGEGLGIVILKRLADARRDGDRVYAVIKGIGSSSDGKGNAIYAPSADGQMQALRRAYELGGATPETIELVEAHGTGTKVGDAAEVTALTQVYQSSGNPGSWCALGSVKSQIGHTKAAAGIAGVIKAVLALHHKVLPPTIKVAQPIEQASTGRSPFYINTQKRPWLKSRTHPRRAAVSAFGFGGSNFHCLLEESGSEKTAVDWDGDIQILAFSDNNLSALRQSLTAEPTENSWEDFSARAAQSRKAFRRENKFRLALVVEREQTDRKKLFLSIHTMFEKHPDKNTWTLPEGAAFGSQPPAGKLGVLFPGQGSQYVGMMRDLACHFPPMLEVLTQANEAFTWEPSPAVNQRLSDLIYPHPAFEEKTKKAQEEALRATEIAQPALGAVSLGALRVLESFGVEPEAAAGHSYGELLALCAAGRIQSETLHKLSNLRGRLMAGVRGDGERGAMLAVKASFETVEQLIQEEQFELVIANRNAPDQFVLAGATPEIARAASQLEQKSVWNRRLPVAAAFHSPMVAAAQQPFEEALRQVSIEPSRIPVFANTTAQEYPSSSAQARKLLAEQLANPVDFVKEITTMFQSGITTFVEVGPGNILTGLVQSILRDHEVAVIALDSSKGKHSGMRDLAYALSRIATMGHAVNLSLWDEGNPAGAKEEIIGKPRMMIPICGANQMNPKPKRPAVVRPPALPPSLSPSNATTISPVCAPTVEIRRASPATLSAPPHLQEVLRMTQENLMVMQRLQEQTAQVHRKFLEGQEAVQRTFHTLLEQQRRLVLEENSGATPTLEHRPEISEVTLPLSAPAAVSPAPLIPPTSPIISNHNAHISAILLKIVSEKTGYPTEMLNLEMGLDSDLGIDSIKRVEIMSALQEKLPTAPLIQPVQLGTLQTLQQIVQFLCQGTNTESAAPIPTPIPSGLTPNTVATVLLQVVSEKTGYPTEMLNLEMGLDSDLGIDSIKRVEIMSALQEKLPTAPLIQPSQLGTLQTLQQIVQFLCQDSNTEPAAPAPTPIPSGLTPSTVATVLLQVVSEKTGYPTEMLNLEMGLDSDLGIDSIKRVEIMSALQEKLPTAPVIQPVQLGTLQTLQQVVNFLCGNGVEQPVPAQVHAPFKSIPTPSPAAIPQKLDRQVLEAVALNGNHRTQAIPFQLGREIWVVDDGSELAAHVEQALLRLGHAALKGSFQQLQSASRPELLGGLIILAPQGKVNETFLKDAFRLVQYAGPALLRAGHNGGAIFTTVSRLDGAFGLAQLNGKSDPLTGGLAGLAKTAKQEWNQVHCKALDLDAEFNNPSQSALAIVSEIFCDGPGEVGIAKDSKFTLELRTIPLAPTDNVAPIQKGDVILISGGARGVTAETALALAKAFQPTLVILGRSPVPETEPDWLIPLREESEIKKAIHARLNGSASLATVETQFRKWKANREIATNLGRMESAGAKVIYRSVDVRNHSLLQALVEEIRKTNGPICGLVHGAGVLADKRIEDKTLEQFEEVYSTKVAGLQSLLSATAEDPLKFLALFSSSTGRFGRTGQVDYAVANEVLNKFAQIEARRRPSCRVVSVNWGPWNGGMVTSSLRKIFEQEGVGLIDLTAGADYFVRELSVKDKRPVEIVVLARLEKEPLKITPATPATLTLERLVSVAQLPCLASHVLDGRAVLPMALLIEWLAHGALHGNPGLLFCGLNDLKIFKGVTIAKEQELTVRAMAFPTRKHEECLLVPMELTSQDKGRTLLHARAEIVLSAKLPRSSAQLTSLTLSPDGRERPDLYNPNSLFHGIDFQGIEKVEGCGTRGIAAWVRTAPAPRHWIAQPLRNTWIADPMALDGSFQMMILWSWAQHHSPSLPCAAGKYRQFKSRFPKEGARVVIQIVRSTPQSATADIEYLDEKGNLLARLEGYECVIDDSLKSAFLRNQLSL